MFTLSRHALLLSDTHSHGKVHKSSHKIKVCRTTMGVQTEAGPPCIELVQLPAMLLFCTSHGKVYVA